MCRLSYPGSITFELVIDGDRVANLQSLAALDPALLTQWDATKRTYTGLLSNLQDVRICTWLLFLYALSEDKTARGKPPWLHGHLRFCMALVCDCIELGALAKLEKGAPSAWDARDQLLHLRTASGRKPPMDPVSFAQLKRRQDLVRGSSNTVAQAWCGPGSNIDRLMTHCMNVLYVEGLRQHYGALTKLCLNWDPASYSGFQYNLGLVYSHQTDVLSIMPPKVAP